ncbi:MAG: lipoprotein-releasing ABC transporter permease subunit [Gammaproteobacteria bacterium]|nr:lipoprotein-releasing ABC transporter permease subunit [Gammaproteobacteria bacterium]
MFRPLALYIGFRYTRAKKRNHFISFIALASMLGIALGITVLITVLSVMNGFDYEIRDRIFGVARQVTVTGYEGGISSWQNMEKEIGNNKDVIASAPFVIGQGMLSKDGVVHGAEISGILPLQEEKISQMQNNMVQGSMSDLKPGEFGVVLGQEIARHLMANLGDKVILVTPQSTVTPIGIEPRFKRFTVVGIFHVSEGFGYDATTAFINIYDAQKLFGLGKDITGFNVKIKDLYRAPMISAALMEQFNGEYFVSDWTYKYGSYLKAIRMEKTMMFVVLLFIIAVAAFNLVSSLVMTVTDKQSDIAILRTLGATPKMIMSIFMVQGSIIGVFGTLLGIVGGVLLALNAPDLVIILERVLHTSFISAGVYFIDYLPSRLEFADVWHVGLVALVMSLLATIYPAWRAAKTQPAQALRYE